ncbi:macrophage colony-stimulating factor 1 receptor 1 isoform X2 [Engraulis encrasicolus]|uniref:macrophage colony-stimulating factor 1 receptor 1 isoform X2 n=1 Tax=Engraulis encrasicolus TaxID=184585 RepID=UPI002FD2A1F1
MLLYLALLLGVLHCAAQDWGPPVIKLNYTAVSTAEIAIPVGSRFLLSCEGDSTVSWKTWPRTQKHHMTKSKSIKVKMAATRNTGGYVCVYDQQPQLQSEVYIYITGGDLFTTQMPTVEMVDEGSTYTFDCSLTDPKATDFSLLRSNGSAAPSDLNYTVDPKKGIHTRDLLPHHTGDYVCSAVSHGQRRQSHMYSLIVNAKIRSPPKVMIAFKEAVRVVGEELRVQCNATSRKHPTMTWTHSSSHREMKHKEFSTTIGEVHIASILTIPSVNLSDSGNITCTASNVVFENSASMYLEVLEKPYIKFAPLSPSSTFDDDDVVDVIVGEGGNIDFGVQMTAYPEIKDYWWETPELSNTSNQENTSSPIKHGYKNVRLLRKVQWEDQGLYTIYARSDKVNASFSFNISVFYKPSVSVRWHNGSLICDASGHPLPTVHWYQCAEIRPICDANSSLMEESFFSQTTVVRRDPSGRGHVESVLHVNHTNNRMTIQCLAKNHAGDGMDKFSLYFTTSEPSVVISKIFTPTLIAASCLVGTLIVLLTVVIYKCKQKPKFEIRWKIIEVNDGNNYTFLDPTQLPYNERWEFPRERLRLGQVLGAGAFGKVVEATAYGLGTGEDVTRVAVKMLKPTAHSEERDALLSELKILSHLGPHSNIVNLLGACTQGGPMLMITEYCGHGDLLNFLRSRAEMFVTSVWGVTSLYKNISEDQRHRSDSGISFSGSDYQDMTQAQQKPRHPSLDCHPEADSRMFGIEDLLRFSYDVAQGMDFLTSRNCIHRDVAARNVLLTESCVAKICDFGLARDIMNDSNYVVKGNARLPVKWMSPESIFDCVYTVQSDVWSYGILLWEIFSLGKSPYPDVMVNSRFYKMIQDGYQMSQPDFAPPEMYSIMKMCWNLEPTQRPTFSEIGKHIEQLLPDHPHQQQYRNLQEALEESEMEELCEGECECEGQVLREGGGYEPLSEHNAEEQQPLMPNNYHIC